MTATAIATIVVAFLSLIASLAAILIATPKAKAEAGNIQAQTVVTLINGFTALAIAHREQNAELIRENTSLKSQAALVGQFARRCDQLELELKTERAKHANPITVTTTASPHE
jgi:hypothetical protein